ncbi:TonB-dependent receptor domain-containing protein [Coraliomargarita parva]|uniref:TonB-dependent receptor domain-containing protein n=1 Tax=Coraliomargarita parva TaxID=3014050 RepID=UPI0022B339EA|nr:TonB-dependent receptor [Coraliomargarita parva]
MRLWSSTFSCICLGLYGAETAEQDGLPIYELPTVTITGTQLQVPESSLATPVAEIDSQSFYFWNDYTPIAALRQEPYLFGAANTENNSNGGSGSAGANLRGMGNLSTLTLLNGRRAGGNSALGNEHGGFADLNLIPAAAIDRIEIANEGSSVAYGSDAVAGTVNVILQSDYTGNRVDLSYGNTTDGDASEKVLSFLSGQTFGKTHLTLSGTWYQRNAIYARDREVSKDADRRDQGGQNQGSSSFAGRLSVDGSEYVLSDSVTAPDSINDYQPWDAVNGLYNFSEEAVAIPAVERKSLMADVSHPLSEQVELWSEWLFTESVFDNGLAPSPWSLSNSPYEHAALFNTILTSSPHIPADINPSDIESIRYRTYELGKLEAEQEKQALRALVGLRGAFSDWNWESALLYIESDLTSTWSGIADARIVADLVESGEFNPFAQNYATGTIPSGPLAGQSYDNAAALAEAEVHPVDEYEESLWSYDFKLNGRPFELPAGPVHLAGGFEYRQEDIRADFDEIFVEGYNLGGPQYLSYGGEREVVSLFAESLLPIYEAGARKLEFSLSARYENYKDRSDDRSVDANRYNAFVYKAGLNFQVNESLRLRFSYGTSFRAPTLTESYGGDSISYPVYADPLGLTPQSARIPTVVQSNPDLDPERSESYNLGFVFEPDPKAGWRFETNYYHIQTEDAIANGAQYFLNSNASAQPAGVTPGTLNPSAPYAGQIIRSGTTGQLLVIYANWFNAAEVETDGIDYELSYRHPTRNGSWVASLGINQVLSYDVTAAPGASTDSYLGDFVDPNATGAEIVACGSIPRYKGFARLLWTQRQLTLGGTVNYIHSLNDNSAYTIDGQAREIDPWTSLDLMAAYTWLETGNSVMKGTTVQVGIENVTDEEPPFAAGAFADGYDTSLYSLAGRRFTIALSRTF